MQEPNLDFRNWMRIMMIADEKNISTIAKEVNATYSNTIAICNKLIAYGLLKGNKVGRMVLLSHTKEGEDMANRFRQINTQLSACETKNIKSQNTKR